MNRKRVIRMGSAALTLAAVLVHHSANLFGQSCTAGFTGTPRSGCAPLKVYFTSTSTGATTYSWDFPGGWPSSGTGPGPIEVNYSMPGVYAVTLRILCVHPTYMGRDTLVQPRYISVQDCPSSIGDTVWTDANKNGLQDKGESGFPGVNVDLHREDGTLVASMATDANGRYLFTGLPSANYWLQFWAPTGYIFSPKDQGSNDLLDSDSDPATGKTDMIWLPPERIDVRWDAGIFRQSPHTENNTFNTCLKVDMDFPGIGLASLELPGHMTRCNYWGSDMGVPYDGDGDGLEDVATELLKLDVQGIDPIVGHVKMILDPTRISKGEIEEQVNNTPGKLDVLPFTPTGKADCYFEAFLEIELPDMGICLRTEQSLRLEGVLSVCLQCSPQVFSSTLPDPVPLFKVTCGGGPWTLPDPPPSPTGYLLNIAYCESYQPSPEYDFGDAPDSYKTLLASNGPRHLLAHPEWCFGALVDPEEDGQSGVGADGDDTDEDGDDEDGIEFLPSSNPKPGGHFDMVVHAEGIHREDLLINGWLDFNRDGDWADPGEKIISEAHNFWLEPSISVPIPNDAVPGVTYARFRICSWPGMSVTGLAEDGEVEDYKLVIEEPPQEYDFGDAPAPYPTLLADNGARHLLPNPGGLLPYYFIGLVVPDAEPDGQPDPHGMGDDFTGTEDDEDGIWYMAPVTPGSIVTFNVYVHSPALPKPSNDMQMYLNGWIDLNADGDWSDPNEHFINDDVVVPMNYTFSAELPSSIPLGITFARFRLSTWPGLSYDGPARDGEVTDIAVKVVGPQSDLGDAPDATNSSGTGMDAYPGVEAHFPTVFNGPPPQGPRHLFPKKVAYLGTNVTMELEADVGPDEDPQNNLNPPGHSANNDGADDGVAVPIELPDCTQKAFPFSVTVVAPPEDLFVNVWFDWNRDGDWNDTFMCGMGPAPEWAVQNQKLLGLVPGFHSIMTKPFFTYHTEPTKPLWMRITLSEKLWSPTMPKPDRSGVQAGQSIDNAIPQGGYLYGETEDYLFIPITNEYKDDYGDAPASYKTLIADNGAYHPIEPGLYLGAAVDPEMDGQPEANAAGDDAAGLDDEDGVTFPSDLLPGGTAFLSAFATLTPPFEGYLDAWIDFNRNGDWADPGEKIIDGIELMPGANALTFPVPASASPGMTYARFRFAYSPTAFFYGFGKGGEVEDYQVQIVDHGKNRVKWNQPPLRKPLWWTDPVNGHRFNGWGVPSVFPFYLIADDWICRDPKPVTGITWWGSYTDWDTTVAPVEAPYAFHIGVWTDTPEGKDKVFSHPHELVKEWRVDRGACGERVAGSHMMGKPDSVFQYYFHIPCGEAFVQEGDSTVYWLSVAALYKDMPDSNVWCWLTRDHFFHDDGVYMRPDFAPALHDTFETGGPFSEGWDASFVLLTTEINRTFDFGDLWDTKFPTLFKTNGAMHEIIPGIYLGAGVDDEPDGQPDDNATGDDFAGSDDEDGVVWPALLAPGSLNQCEITVAWPGYLSAWIDFNSNLSWDDPGEKVFYDVPLRTGTTRLVFEVPGGIDASPVPARVRFSTEKNLTYKGRAIDGEVEDYWLPMEVSGVRNGFGKPETYSLSQNYPNPFNPSTAIEFTLPKPGRVTLVLYNLVGQEVAVLVDGPREVGRHTVVWDGTDKTGRTVSDGLYLCRIEAGSFKQTKKLLLVK